MQKLLKNITGRTVLSRSGCYNLQLSFSKDCKVHFLSINGWIGNDRNSSSVVSAVCMYCLRLIHNSQTYLRTRLLFSHNTALFIVSFTT